MPLTTHTNQPWQASPANSHRSTSRRSSRHSSPPRPATPGAPGRVEDASPPPLPAAQVARRKPNPGRISLDLPSLRHATALLLPSCELQTSDAPPAPAASNPAAAPSTTRNAAWAGEYPLPALRRLTRLQVGPEIVLPRVSSCRASLWTCLAADPGSALPCPLDDSGGGDDSSASSDGYAPPSWTALDRGRPSDDDDDDDDTPPLGPPSPDSSDELFDRYFPPSPPRRLSFEEGVPDTLCVPSADVRRRLICGESKRQRSGWSTVKRAMVPSGEPKMRARLMRAERATTRCRID